jgi:hypothetical protein
MLSIDSGLGHTPKNAKDGRVEAACMDGVGEKPFNRKFVTIF